MSSGERVRVRVPAKVNLALRVGPRRADGFHGLATVFHAIGIDDYVDAAPGTGVSLTVLGPDAGSVPADPTNLAWRAALALAEHAGVAADVALTIDKIIPVAGGMAGGSADAAATLVACDALWGLRTPSRTLEQIAAGLGSDVPFALRGGTAVGTGRGEALTTVFGHGRFHWVVVPSTGPGLSTPAVYAEYDRVRPDASVPDSDSVAEVVAACRAGSPELLANALCNDLQEAALSLMPSLREVLDHGRDHGALAGLVSGSGPTCVFLASSEDHAWDLAATFPYAGVASGPVAGAARVT
ncbi:4-(cytidine 5'-diphospho)-2-C-methyl-D-erythritol kinase [Jatrophihabitans sp. YIM 134969]